MPTPTHVDGAPTVPILIYTLSTCGWCKKTKQYLNELGVAYDYVDVDMAGDERDAVMEEVRKWNPSCSFPTVVVAGKEAIVGFQPDRLKKVVG